MTQSKHSLRFLVLLLHDFNMVQIINKQFSPIPLSLDCFDFQKNDNDVVWMYDLCVWYYKLSICKTY